MTSLALNNPDAIARARYFGRYAVIAVTAVVMAGLWVQWRPTALTDSMRGALQASLVIALATGVGAVPALVIRNWTAILRDSLMGFSAGVMLGATVFTLCVPALAEARQLWVDSTAVGLVGLAMLAGAVLLWFADRIVPHEHLVIGHAGLDSDRVRGVWLVVMTMALHHVPEGFAVGASFGHSQETGLLTALGIGLQSLPEGLVVAAGLTSIGYGRSAALGVAVLTGLAQPLGALLGAGLSTVSESMLPLMLAVAAGAMLFVTSHEVIPESHREGNETAATFALMGGFVMMLILTTLLA